MPYTQLSPIALPGKRYSFSPKTEAVPAKGAGPFTELSVTATPGRIHSFSAKTAAIPSGKGVGPFTELSVMATPGRIHSFTAKTEAEVTRVGGRQPSWHYRMQEISREDEETIAMLIALIERL